MPRAGGSRHPPCNPWHSGTRRGRTGCMAASPLVLGPMLRFVDETSASIWVETRADCLRDRSRRRTVMARPHLRRARPPLRARGGRPPRAGHGATLRRAGRRPERLAGGGLRVPAAADRDARAGSAGADRLRVVPHECLPRPARESHARRGLAARLRTRGRGRPGRPSRPAPVPGRPGVRGLDLEGDAGLHPQPARHPRGAGQGAQGLRGVRAPLRSSRGRTRRIGGSCPRSRAP